MLLLNRSQEIDSLPQIHSHASPEGEGFRRSSAGTLFDAFFPVNVTQALNDSGQSLTSAKWREYRCQKEKTWPCWYALLPLNPYRGSRRQAGVNRPLSGGENARRVTATILLVVLFVFSFLVIISLWGFYSSIRPPKLVSSLTPRDLKMAYQDVSFRNSRRPHASRLAYPIL
jgi:hypothetical protein